MSTSEIGVWVSVHRMCVDLHFQKKPSYTHLRKSVYANPNIVRRSTLFRYTLIKTTEQIGVYANPGYVCRSTLLNEPR